MLRFRVRSRKARRALGSERALTFSGARPFVSALPNRPAGSGLSGTGAARVDMISPHSRSVSSAPGRDAVAPRRSRRRAGASALDVWLARVPAHDELVVVVAHQTIELWFNQLLCELGVLVVDLDGDN